MAIELPGKGAVGGLMVGTELNAGAAMAPWRALGEVGQEVQQMGQAAMETVVKLQRVENQRMADDLALKADEEFERFQTEMLQNPGAATQWVDQWSKRRDAWLKANVPQDLAPEQRAILGSRIGQWSSLTSREVGRHAALATISQAKVATGNLVTRSLATGNYDMGIRAIQDAPYLTDPEKEAARLEFDGKFEAQEIQQDAELDPKGTRERLLEKNEDGTWKNYRNLSPSNRNNAISAAERNFQQGTYDTVEQFNVLRLNGAITPDQVEKKFPNVSAGLQLQMKRSLERDLTEADRKRMASPEYQSWAFGRVNALMDGYTPTMEGFDERFFEIDQIIRTLPEGEMKARANHRLDQVRKDKLGEWNDKADPYRDRFKYDKDAGAFGFGSSKQALQDVLADGILSDRGKLVARGLSAEQAEVIASGKASESALKEMGFSDAEAKRLAEGEGIEGQITLFREIDKKRQGYDSGDAYVREAYDAIARGNTGFIEWPNRAAEEEAERKYGAALGAWEKWYRLNPEATSEQMEKKYYEIVKPSAEQGFRGDLLPGLPGLDGMVLPPKQ